MDRLQFIATSLPSLPPSFLSSSLSKLGKDSNLPSSYAKMRALHVAKLVKNPPAMQRPGFTPWVGKIPWRREGLPTPVFLPGELHGQRSLVGYSPWRLKESDTT